MANSENQKDPIPAPKKAIPLFVDVGVNVIVSAAFSNNLINGKDNIYTPLPLIVSSVYYPNIYFSLIAMKELKSVIKKTIKDKKFEFQNYDSIHSFAYLNNITAEKNKHFAFGLENLDDSNSGNKFNQIYKIINHILNPLGIGAFYSPNTGRLKGFKLFSELKEGLEAEKLNCEFVPYSMEAARQMLFQCKDEEFSVFSIASLMILQYPLPKITIPRPNLKILRDRFIFSTFIINNPPIFTEQNTRKSFILDFNSVENKSQKLIKLNPCQWAHLSIYVPNNRLNPNSKIEAVITQSDGESIIGLDFDVFDYTNSQSIIRKPFYKNEVDIMHPDGGYLWISGIDFHNLEDTMAVDVFLK